MEETKPQPETNVELPPKAEAPCECHCHKYNHGLPEGQSCACVTNCKHCNANWQEGTAPETPPEAPKPEPMTVAVTKVEPEPSPLCGKCSKPKSGAWDATPEWYCKCGRPMKFQSLEDLQKQIDAYFAECDPHWVPEEYPAEIMDDKGKGTGKYEWRIRTTKTEQQPYTITGLAVALETSREVLLDYQDMDEFSDAIKKAKQKIHAYAEKYLFQGKNQAGVIFNLKNNWNWKDKTEVEADIKSGGEKLQPGVIVLPPKQ